MEKNREAAGDSVPALGLKNPSARRHLLVVDRLILLSEYLPEIVALDLLLHLVPEKLGYVPDISAGRKHGVNQESSRSRGRCALFP